MPLLDVQNLAVEFQSEGPGGERRTLRAVDGVSFSVEAGRTLGVVGESGSGKSVSQLALMGLITPPAGKVVSGAAWFDGRDLLKLPAAEMRKLRGKRAAMVFQDPLTSLNPFLTIGEQLTEVVQLHQGATYRAARDRAVETLQQVGIPKPGERLEDYPHQFSGGMRQRVMIAMALLCEPELLIADEPTTALDVTIQAQILRLIAALQEKRGTAVILITHHLGIVARTCHEVQVMYSGRIVERGAVREVFAAPKHPYTQGLLRSLPRLDTPRGQRMPAIPGQPPSPADRPAGCPFAPRCEKAVDRCLPTPPPLYALPGGRQHACLVAAEQEGAAKAVVAAS